MYPQELVLPMTRELTQLGFQSLVNADEVKKALDQNSGTTLLVINSVCGCAAANARPGVRVALQMGPKPDQLITVFAGVDREAVQIAREYLLPYPPSSPAIALFKEGQLVHMLERHHIEGRSAQMIAENLAAAFANYCTVNA
ncbi:MAG: BrxA/BrxB family bacilliredoxin [Saprospiraceae bacterium]|nr:BrxA/BrxB family bacilliredoxin [Saprospiraceae bacterium]